MKHHPAALASMTATDKERESRVILPPDKGMHVTYPDHCVILTHEGTQEACEEHDGGTDD